MSLVSQAIEKLAFEWDSTPRGVIDFRREYRKLKSDKIKKIRGKAIAKPFLNLDPKKLPPVYAR